MIDIEHVLEHFTSTVKSKISGILGSSLWTAIFIMVIIFIILMTIYPTQKNQPVGNILRPTFYMFFCTFMIVFLHDSYLLDDASKTVLKEKTDEIVGGMKEFRNRETNIYKALHGEDGYIKPRVHEDEDTNTPIIPEEPIDHTMNPIDL